MEIKYFVRTTGERNFNYDIPYETLVDKERDPIGSMIKQMKYISEWDSVFLEDDLKLCKNFKERIENVICQYPDNIITFYINPYAVVETGLYRKGYESNCCVYYPKVISKIIAEGMEKLDITKFEKSQYSRMQREVMENMNIPFVVYRPCLVQHMGKQSLIGNNWNYGNGMTPFFIDDMYNIDYNNEEELKKYHKKKMKEMHIFNSVATVEK